MFALVAVAGIALDGVEARPSQALPSALTLAVDQSHTLSPAAGERLTDIAAGYGVNRKTIRRRLDAAELADAERARRTAAKRAEEKRMKRLDRLYRNPAARPEHARRLKPASPSPPSREPEYAGRPASTAVRRRASGGRIGRLDRSPSYADWLDERDARVPAPPDRRVQLVTESGETIARTSESNAERHDRRPRTPPRPADGRPRIAPTARSAPAVPSVGNAPRSRAYPASSPRRWRRSLLAPCAAQAALMSRGSSATTTSQSGKRTKSARTGPVHSALSAGLRRRRQGLRRRIAELVSRRSTFVSAPRSLPNMAERVGPVPESAWWRPVLRLLSRLVPRRIRDWLRARFHDVDAREGRGYAVWLTMGVVIAIPEIWAAVGGTNVPWPTISGTVGNLEWHWSPTALFVVGLILFAAFHALRYPPSKTGELAVQADHRKIGRTEGGRVTRSPDRRPREWSPYRYFLLALAAVVGSSLITAALDGSGDRRWHLAYVLYGLIALFWVVIPSVAAYWFARDVPFPTLFSTVASLQRRLHFVAIVLATGLAVLLLHLAFYPWPSISHILQKKPPTTHSK